MDVDIEDVDSVAVMEPEQPDQENVILEELPVEKLYEMFAQANYMSTVMDSFEALKSKLGLQKLQGLDLYRGLKLKLGTQKTWKARDVFQLLEKRANQKEYMQHTAAKGVRVFIVGAGPVGLRLAIDCLLMGTEAVVVEKRTSFSRNNVLHVWPATIEDLRQLGAKKFYGKFCAGAIDHISIRSLQCILLKVCLLLGVRIYTDVEFVEIMEPTDSIGWHAKVNPSEHPLNEFEFDVLVGTDGRRSTIPGFDRKELRGKLALAITANFVNYYSRDEAAVQEISGVAFIFNQKFFKDLRADTGIDLENIVYYKDDTHYFVMTAKKESLLKKGVLREDLSDTRQLLHPNNIDQESLYDYAIEAADWSTELPRLDFALNHYDKPDVALFDFTSIYQAEYAARAIRRKGKDLFLCVAGDALLEPFWPTGTGCARGFLSAMDTAWLIQGLGQKRKVLDLLSERECIFQRLPQTTPENLQKNFNTYTIDPCSRYVHLNFRRVKPGQVKHLYDMDDDSPSPLRLQSSIKVKRMASEDDDDLKENIPESKRSKEEGPADQLLASPSRRPLMEKGSVHLAYYSEAEDKNTLRDPMVLQQWLQEQVKDYGIKITDLSSSLSNGMALCALIHRFHPELIPDFAKLSPSKAMENNQLAFSIAEEHLGINSLIKPSEMDKPDKLGLFTYLSLFYELFVGREPAAVLPEKPSKAEKEKKKDKKTPKKKMSLLKRRSSKTSLATSPSSVERSWNTKTVKRTSMSPPVSPVKTAVPPLSAQAAKKKSSGESKDKSKPKPRDARPKSQFGAPTSSSDICCFCSKRVYLMERMSANGLYFHRSCFRCSHCNCQLKIGGYSLSKGDGGEKGKFFCTAHYRQLFLSNPEAINYQRAGAPKRGSREEEVVSEREPQELQKGHERLLSEDIIMEEDEEEFVEIMAPESPPPADVEMREASASPPRVLVSTLERSGEQHPMMNGKSHPSQEATPPVQEPERMERSPSPKILVTPASRSRRGKVSDLLAGFENLEANAQFEMELAIPIGRDRPSSQRSREVEGSLGVSDERSESGRVSPGSSKPTLEDLQRYLSPIAAKWYQLGLKLRLSSAELHDIEKKCMKKKSRTNMVTFLTGTLKLWLAKAHPSPNWSGLIIALRAIEETELADKLKEQYGIVIRRSRSPCQWRGTRSRQNQPEDIPHIARSNATSGNRHRPYRKGRGQRSVTRPLIGTYDTSDVAIQERRKQQQRFREAQLIQREMSQLDRQYEELEEVGREIEQVLRDADDTSQEDNFMKSWLNLVKERNGLVRKTAELSLKMKELELEDRQYEVDKELNELSSLPDYELTDEERRRFEELCEQKIKIVEERNDVVMQAEDERIRELEEDDSTSQMFDEQFGNRLGRRLSQPSTISAPPSSSDYSPPSRRTSAPPEASVEAILMRDDSKRRSRLRSWLGFGGGL